MIGGMRAGKVPKNLVGSNKKTPIENVFAAATRGADRGRGGCYKAVNHTP